MSNASPVEEEKPAGLGSPDYEENRHRMVQSRFEDVGSC